MMSTVFAHNAPMRKLALSSWAPMAVGLLALIVPTYVMLNATLWNEEAYQHGMIVVAVFWWLAWRNRERLGAMPAGGAPIAGALTLGTGLLMYFVGRSQSLPLFEVAAHLPLLIGAMLLALGWPAVRVMWFPLAFLTFMVPLPGFVIVAMTSELKQVVSVVAEALLYHAGYPIARDGVVISIGQYQMLVADACSGLNSIYSLSALCVLYMYLSYRPGWVRNVLLLGAIVPIAFVANVTRVMVLILLTYYYGDEVGQGFLHNASGVLLFVVALLVLLMLDWLLLRVTRALQHRAAPGRVA